MPMDYDDSEDFEEIEPSNEDIISGNKTYISAMIDEFLEWKKQIIESWSEISGCEKSNTTKQLSDKDLDNLDRLEKLHDEYCPKIDSYVRNARCSYRKIELDPDIVFDEAFFEEMIKHEESTRETCRLFNDFIRQYAFCYDIFRDELKHKKKPDDWHW